MSDLLDDPDDMTVDDARQAEACDHTDRLIAAMRLGKTADQIASPPVSVTREAKYSAGLRSLMRDWGWKVDIGDTSGKRGPWHDVEPIGAEVLIPQGDGEPRSIGVTAATEELATARLFLLAYATGLMQNESSCHP